MKPKLIKNAEQGLRLEQLSAALLYERSTKHTVLDFIKSQRNMEVIRFEVSVDRPNAECISELFFHILESCPNLKEYRFRTEQYEVVFGTAELRRFVVAISKLKFLSLNFRVLNEPVPAYLDSPSNSAHLNLTSFEWINDDSTNTRSTVFARMDIASDFFDAFIQRCPSLRHLKLHKCCDTMLQTIFQYLVELRTLVLLHGEACTDFGLTGHDVNGEEKGYSLKRLQKLKHLKLENFKHVHMEKVALESHLPPRLEFLNLGQGFYLRLSEEDSSRVTSYLSELRVLAIERIWDKYSTVKIVQFCRQLKNLYRLTCFELYDGCDRSRDFPRELSRSLFDACPGLRYISDPGRACETTFALDLSTRNIFEKEDLHFSENIFEDEFLRTEMLRYCV